MTQTKDGERREKRPERNVYFRRLVRNLRTGKDKCPQAQSFKRLLELGLIKPKEENTNDN